MHGLTHSKGIIQLSFGCVTYSIWKAIAKANRFRVAKDYERSKAAYEKASKGQEMLASPWDAAKHMESAANMAKELRNWREVCGRPQPASDALAKGARALEETMPEEAIQLYTDVITILEEDGGGQIAFDLYPKLDKPALIFCSRVKFFSILDPTRPCNYVSEISDAGFLGPLFKVTMEEHPTEAFTNTSADKCWETILDRLNAEIERCKSLGEQELPPLEVLQSINGHKMFGFLKPSIIQAIEAQDPSHQCVEYWHHKELSSESSGSGNDASKCSNGSSNSLGDVKTKTFGFNLIKQEQEDNIEGHFYSFEEMKSLLQGFLKLN
ncbi:hypothetical protein AHAS_Ahas20G0119200 [Arachis hypogaea]